VLFTADMERNALASAWPSWALYLLALFKGNLVAALYMRPALETRPLRVAAPLLGIATLIGISGLLHCAGSVFGRRRKADAQSGRPITLAFLMVTAIAQRANVRR
jgi:ABC-type Na+ efflux pump permease subunit